MMKFKSLFRRSQQSHQSQQKQHRRLKHNNNQQQVLPPCKSSSSISLLEGKTKIPIENSASGSSLVSSSSWKDFNRMKNLELDEKQDKQNKELAWMKEQHRLELEQLTKEIEALRTLLRNVTHSPLSDSQKQQLLLDANKSHNSAPGSIAVIQDVDGATISNASQENVRNTSEWDKHSTSSEVSVGCLQDRLLQMEENNYTTNEELQATIQELSDLQTQLTELQADNERLTEEKGVLLDSLCRQTEKLEDSRTQVDTLQGLLLKEEKPEEHPKGYNTEREQKLVDLLKSAQEERANLLQKQEELMSELKNLQATAEASATEVVRLTKRIHFLESTIDAANIERKLLDLELRKTKQDSTNRNIEINRLTSLLENARLKIEELEQPRNLDNNKADERLDAARQEKDELEIQTVALRQQLSRSHCDLERLRGQYTQLQEDYKTSRNNAKTTIEELEYRLEQLKEEKSSVSTELQLVRDSLSELQTQCQRHLEDKRELKAALSDLQRREREMQSRQQELESALSEECKSRQQERTEWEQFQTDLLMTVRVANDFKTEAQSELERVLTENKIQRDKLRTLEAQLDKLKNLASQKNMSLPASKIATTTKDTSQCILTNVQQEMLARRKANIARQDSRLSVKCLIESIENATKQAKTGTF